MGDAEASGGFDNFIEELRHNLRQAWEALERIRGGRERRDNNLDRGVSDWVSEAESLHSFSPLQLDTFHAVENSYYPSSELGRPAAQEEGARRRPAMSRK